MSAPVRFEAWTEGSHYYEHLVAGVFEETCRPCHRDRAGRQQNLAEAASIAKAARDEREGHDVGLMLAYFLAVVLITAGLLVAAVVALPFNGAHLLALVLVVVGSWIGLRATHVARKRAAR